MSLAQGSFIVTLDDLAKQISDEFTDGDFEIIKHDAKEFYCLLEREGFIISGETIQECNEKDTKFSYRIVASEAADESSSPDDQLHLRSTQEFLEEYFDGQHYLTNLHIEITSRCNERCIHCYIPNDCRSHEMEPSLFYDVLRQCKEMNVLHLTISGGEPMLHRHFIDFLRKCREYEFSVNVLSNLTLLDDEIITEIKSNHLLGIQVSLYSMNSDKHDQITKVKGSFDKTKSAILKLIEHDVPLQIACPIIKQNKNCYQDVVNWAKERKIQVGYDHVVLAEYNHSTQNLSCRLSIEEVGDVIRERISKDAKYLQQMEEEACKKRGGFPDDSVCSVCYSSICVSDNGNLYPCAGWQDYVVGNVKNAPLREIWDNSEKVQYLRGLRNLDFPRCIQCADKEFCTMCMVRNANEHTTGDPLAVNEYFCSVAKLNKQLVLGSKQKPVDPAYKMGQVFPFSFPKI
uniref:Radical SAM superfamily enzyme, MoaA/NifB/PqqE/SkfB family n=1 Tax=Candidatus Kentrum sp. MB TaxID=2138164 RepID=A0A450XI74_9GAMM|nr:MAG: Radical SAM superfamily enzyme, MoaA/NifB/PqqE/SkfB family [Candidatus Kentron sp. MB]